MVGLPPSLCYLQSEHQVTLASSVFNFLSLSFLSPSLSHSSFMSLVSPSTFFVRLTMDSTGYFSFAVAQFSDYFILLYCWKWNSQPRDIFFLFHASGFKKLKMEPVLMGRRWCCWQEVRALVTFWKLSSEDCGFSSVWLVKILQFLSPNS